MSVLGRDQSHRRGGNSQCQTPSNENTLTCGFQPGGYFGEADKEDTSTIAQRGRRGGGRRGRRQGRGRSQAGSRQKDPPFKKEPPVRANPPKRRVTLPAHGALGDDGLCASKVAKILSELQGRRSAGGGSVEEGREATKSKTSDDKEQQG